MFRRKRSIVILLLMGLLLLSGFVIPVQAQAQPDNFPIGLYVVYTVDNQIPPGEEDIHTVRYDFREWVDQDNLLIQYEKEDVISNEYLYEIYHDGPEHPPIWLDPSLFQSQSIFTFSGFDYHYVGIEKHWVPGIEEDCFRIEYSITVNGMENWSMLYYHCETGIMIDYIHAAFYEDYELREGCIAEVFGTNLDEFNPPSFILPEPTTTTETGTTTTFTTSPSTSTTTTTTSTPHTYPPPIIRTTTSPGMSLSSVDVIMVIGIFIEILIISFIFSKRE